VNPDRASAKQMIRDQRAGDEVQAEQRSARAGELSGQVVALLDAIEQKVPF
jgi:hypothetical protein